MELLNGIRSILLLLHHYNMTQADCIKLLEKTKRWMTAKEISSKLKISNATANLLKLYKYGEIIRKPDKCLNGGRYLYKIK